MLTTTAHMPLVRHACLVTGDVERARNHLSALFWPHQLDLGSGARAVSFRHHQARCASVSFNALRYGREVAIRVTPSDPAYLVKFTLAGLSELTQQQARAVSHPGMVCVMNPARPFAVHLSADHNQLTLRIDGARLSQFLEAELGYRPRAALEFTTAALLCREQTPGLARLVGSLCEDFDDAHAGLCTTRMAPHIEAALFGSLLTELPHNYSARLLERPQQPRALGLVRDYIAGHMGEALDLAQLARVAQTSTRALQQSFRQHLGTTPMAYLRDQRLDHARDLLHRNRTASVTEVALACGFTHLSRFARYYRERFGQAPHNTRAD